MKQPTLPFKNLQVPAAHLRWFQAANAGDYFEKRWLFYPFKSRFLRAHAVTDGFDLQTIVKKCWCGDGIWRGRDDDLPKRLWQICDRCHGTGIYETKKIVLVRWLLNGLVFHTQSEFTYAHWAADDTKFKNHFSGLITHAEVPSATARRAMERLLLRYEPSEFLKLWQKRWRDWSSMKRSKIKFRIREVKELLRLVEKQDVPF